MQSILRKITKGCITLIGVLLLVFGLMSIGANAASNSDLTFTLNSDGKSYSVTDCNESAGGELVIPATYNGLPVTSIGDHAFRECTKLTSITIPNSVISIGDHAFRECTELTSITLGDGVISIGACAFYDCTSLTSVVIPDSVTNLGSNVFRNCYKLTSVTIPNSVTAIPDFAFYDCDKLTSVTIPDSVTSIGSYAFYSCNSLTAITIPNSVTEIGYDTFSYCPRLTSITIPNSVTSIGSSAFEGCSSLTAITIPNSVTSIDIKTFYNCKSLTEIIISNSVTSIGNSAFSYCTSLTSITIPNSVTKIGSTAFSYCPSLTSITIPNSVTSIGSSAFEGCSSLTAITIPDSVTNMGGAAFRGCTSLESITIPFVGDSKKTVSSHYQYPFGYIFGTLSYTGCVATTQYYYNFINSSTTSSTYYIPQSLKSVTVTGGILLYGAFYNCTNLTEITVCNSVTSIEYGAFYNCVGLTSITIGDSVTNIAHSAFSGCSSLESMTIPYVGGSKKTASDTYQYPFGYIFGTSSYTGGVAITQRYYGSSTSSITSSTYYIPQSLKSVTVTGGNLLYGAFYNCAVLTSITIPEDLTNIERYAFYGCKSLSSITIPGNVRSIGSSVFGACTSLTSIRVDDSNRVYSSDYYGVLYNKNKTKLLQMPCAFSGAYTIPDGVTSIGVYAFEGCSSLTAITIPDSVTSIGAYAFHDCSSLTSVTIPDGVTEISNYAFYDCSSLTTITIPESVTSVGSDVFMNCMNLTYSIYDNAKYLGNAENPYFVLVGVKSSSITTLKIHGDTKIIGGSAFAGCYWLTSVTIPAGVVSMGNSAFSNCRSLKDVYYDATQAQWDAISIGKSNEPLQNAVLHCKMFEELEDGTLKLAGNIVTEELTLQAGQVLDLNGYTLTVDSLASFGQIIDSVGGGGLIAGNIEISGNDWLPIQDESGCYRFYEYEQESLGTKATSDSVTFGFALDFADAAAYSALLATQDVQINVTLDWGKDQQTFAFSKDLVTKYMNLVSKYPNLQPALQLKVTGLDSLEEGTVITVTPAIFAVGGKIQTTGETMTYTA